MSNFKKYWLWGNSAVCWTKKSLRWFGSLKMHFVDVRGYYMNYKCWLPLCRYFVYPLCLNFQLMNQPTRKLHTYSIQLVESILKPFANCQKSVDKISTKKQTKNQFSTKNLLLQDHDLCWFIYISLKDFWKFFLIILIRSTECSCPRIGGQEGGQRRHCVWYHLTRMTERSRNSRMKIVKINFPR